ncbi:MAG: LytR C-terminal domain-containing protein [Gordonia sp. (in: high G+C Gram-positive bacteria)]|uniref:LytR C-terminal domain-containing protein n=1 Tax=Gordonia sp. (in: high G+C Gram-positive bacteria) TaxID=84139 RepID=UPI0039E4246A
MKADREPNRLPLRAGAMVLFALAVVFLFLGLFSVFSGGDDPKDDLAKEGTATSASAAPSSAAASSADKPKVDASDVPKLCVLNAGTTTGLAKEVGDKLTAAGFALGTTPSNLSTSSVTENTIFYDAGDEAAAKKVADAVPGGADTTPRPEQFTRCPGELVVVVVQ